MICSLWFVHCFCATLNLMQISTIIITLKYNGLYGCSTGPFWESLRFPQTGRKPPALSKYSFSSLCISFEDIHEMDLATQSQQYPTTVEKYAQCHCQSQLPSIPQGLTPSTHPVQYPVQGSTQIKTGIGGHGESPFQGWPISKDEIFKGKLVEAKN